MSQTASQPTMSGKEIDHHIHNVWSLSEYLAWINREDTCLVADLAHWAEYGITTAAGLADYLDAACERNVSKSEMSAYD